MSTLERRFRDALPRGLEGCSLRAVREVTETLAVVRDVLQPTTVVDDAGAMVTVRAAGGEGYAATPDTSVAGLRAAIDAARAHAEAVAKRPLVPAGASEPPGKPTPRGPQAWRTREEQPWSELPVADKVALLRDRAKALRTSDKIVDWRASVLAVSTDVELVTEHGTVEQSFRVLSPELAVVASEGATTQRRSFGGRGRSQQGGVEVLERVGFHAAPERLAAEALELLAAENCPSGTFDLLLDADQMMLQIHESIGHPLELDRILGDERNFAGTSFVTLDMFGSYRYGSELLDVTFDPTDPREFASYGFDDEGTPATREYVIRKGVLERPLGSARSQARAGTKGVANARASSWNRAPIDRMANLNVEPGDSSFEQLVAKVERGVFMRTNTSWSIDDARNKFQFGCEWARLIENGKLGRVVKNPNYRGISASFWRSLKGVGDRSTTHVLGTPFCGKGEPNQVVRVGHASPACLFGDVAVFGGA